ncbi:MAG: Asp23/Gls24 family envelope stress response protein [Firmicutes bacterium]|nr:Asp23/Gls24 family envelope stress response protein [Oscillospiraceae bacterium]MBS5433366.1 Asp23/Gls24 family envelope stress response protein [Bacillota bacterium]
MGENYITCQGDNGSINISEEVITSIVRTAISEVEGVAGLSNTAGSELAELIGLKTGSRGVKVQFVEDKIVVDLIITVSYGSNIVGVAKSVQEKVMNIVQSTTGIEQAEVNVHVSGIAFDK